VGLRGRYRFRSMDPSPPDIDVGALPDSLSSLAEWVQVGGLFRASPDDHMAGRCGGLLERDSSQAGSAYCARAAGWGTDHNRIARCKHHEGNYVDGLPPWLGDLTEEQWIWMCGARPAGVPALGVAPVERVRRKFEDFVRMALESEDRDVYDAVRADPVLLIDQAVKLNRVQAVKVLRWMRLRQGMLEERDTYLGGPTRDGGMERAEATLQRLDLIMARLLEIRVRYSELEDQRDRSDEVTRLLQSMSQEDFSVIRRDPSRWSQLTRGSLPRGHDA
jgi:hypothetical protein